MVSGSGLRDDPAVREAAAIAEQDRVGRPRRRDGARAGEQEAEIALLAAMQMPVARVGAGVERFDQAEVAIDAHQQHRAVAARALDVGHVVIRRADPFARRRNDAGAGSVLVHGGSDGYRL